MEQLNMDHETVGEVYAVWITSMQEKVSPSTYRRYSNLSKRHILPSLGEIQIDHVSKEKLKDFISVKQEEGLSDSTLRMVILIVKNLLRSAGNETEAGVKIKQELHVEVPKEKTQMLSVEEAQKLEHYLLAQTDAGSLVILLGLKMGLQLGELCALRWQDIDMEKHLLHVNHVVQRFPAKYGRKKTELVLIEPSGENQKRSIPIPDSVMKCLEIRRKEDEKKCVDLEESFLAGCKAGKLPEPRTQQYRFQKVLAELGLPNYKFQVLRHTFGFCCAEMGMDMKLLSRMMGHSSTMTTAGRYAVGRERNVEEQIGKFMRG